MAFSKIRFYLTVIPHQQDNKSLWGIAWMSFFWSASSLMVFSLLPVFVTEVLGASNTELGLIEGIAIFMAFVSKVFSGVLSDYWRKRKPIMIFGNVCSIIIKPMFAFATSVTWVFAARFIDRLSKGIRSSPTDALIADLAPKNSGGASYGLRQALYTLGAVFGSFIATLLMYFTDHHYRLIFALSAIPAIVALFILIFFIHQPPIPHEIPNGLKNNKLVWRWHHLCYLPLQYWLFLGIAALLMLARFSEAFLTLRAKEVGWSVTLLPMLTIIMDLLYAVVVYPIGRLADKQNRHKILLLGVIVLIMTNIVMFYVTNVVGVFFGILLVGLHMGMTQGVLSALIAQSTPSDFRGTAFALYYLVAGISVLIGNTIAGKLSDIYGLRGAFAGGLIFTSLAAMAVWLKISWMKKQSNPKTTL